MGNRNSGPRPTPTALKILRGFRKDRINQHEPKPPSDPVVKPTSLSSAAGLSWARLAPVCLTMQTLTCADLDAFGTLCELVGTLHCATREKDTPRFRPIVKGRAHPALKLERETAAALRPYF